MNLSVIVPLYNEEQNISLLYKKITETLNKIKDYEIILVDDGSRDRTYSLLKNIANKDKKVKLIRHRTNFGQTAALTSGFRHATKDIIVTMDGDLQNDPADIHRLLKKLNEGYDMICGWRYNRKDPFFTKKIPSVIANKIRRLIAKDPVHDSGCSLKAFKGNLLKNISLLGDTHRFFPALLQWEGYRIGEIKVGHYSRYAGQTKYNFNRIFHGLFDLVSMSFWYNYSKKPLHLFATAGLTIISLAILLLAYILIKTFLILHIEMTVGPLLLLTVLLFLAGLQLILFGFLGEMQARIYYKSNPPSYE